MNRPQVMNALNMQMHEELSEAFHDFRDDPELRVAIITGAGEKAFSAGDDINELDSYPGGQPIPPGGLGGISHHFECWKPIIAAVNGYALAGGMELAIACDIIIAAEHASFGLPEPIVARVAAGGGVQRLPRQIPLKIAMGMILAGRRLSAREACQVGLVNEVVSLNELMPAAEQWAQKIILCSPQAIKASKEMAITGLDTPLEASLNMMSFEFKNLALSEDYIEGPKAFLEKRPPVWKDPQ